MRFLELALLAMSAGCYSSSLFAQTSPGNAGPLTAPQITALEQYATEQYGLPTFKQPAETPQAVKNPPTLPQAPKVPTAAAPKECAVPLINVLPKNAANIPMPRVVPRQSTDPGMPIAAGLPTCPEPLQARQPFIAPKK